MDLMGTLKLLAPTVASSLLGPLAPAAVAAISGILGVSAQSSQDLNDAIAAKGLTPEQLTEIKKLELDYKNQEAERGFKYTELEFKDRDSARNANTVGGVQKHVFVLSCVLLFVCLTGELLAMFVGVPKTVDSLVVGRILGLLDGITWLVLNYHYGSSSSSRAKTEMLAQKAS